MYVKGVTSGETPSDRTASHLESAILAAVIQAVLGAVNRSMDSLQTASGPQKGEIIIDLVGTAPGIATLVGWIGAIAIGGPFGLVGFPIGAFGGSLMISPNSNPIAGFFLALFGGTLTWIGIQLGGWRPFL